MSAPPNAFVKVVTVTFEYPPTSPTGVKTLAPLGAVESDIKELRITIFPVDGFLPTIPSPNTTWYFPSSASSTQYTFAVELTVVVSFARVYENKFVTVADDCIFTVNVDVSVLEIRNLNFFYLILQLLEEYSLALQYLLHETI